MKLFLLLLLSACSSHQFRPVILPEGQTYMEISSGRIHRNCLEKFGMTLVSLIDETSSEGLACLKRLKGNGSEKNYLALKGLFASKKITYSCIQPGEFWDKFQYAAHASISHESDVKEYDLIHPFISINPKSVLEFSHLKGISNSPETMKETLFHESFHLIGYRHGYTVDYSYACEVCCFTPYGEDQNSACKICATDYKGITDNRYIIDMWNLSETSSFRKYMLREQSLRMMLLRKPGSNLHLQYLFNDDNPNNMVFKYFALKLPKKKYTERFLAKSFGPYNDPFIPLAKEAAEIDELLYVKGKFNEAKNKFKKLMIEVLNPYLDDDVSVRIWASISRDMIVMRERMRLEKFPKDDEFMEKCEEVLRIGEKIRVN